MPQKHLKNPSHLFLCPHLTGCKSTSVEKFKGEEQRWQGFTCQDFETAITPEHSILLFVSLHICAENLFSPCDFIVWFESRLILLFTFIHHFYCPFWSILLLVLRSFQKCPEFEHVVEVILVWFFRLCRDRPSTDIFLVWRCWPPKKTYQLLKSSLMVPMKNLTHFKCWLVR